MISSKCFQVPSDLGTTCSKLNSGKARQAMVRASSCRDGWAIDGADISLFEVNLLFSLRPFSWPPWAQHRLHSARLLRSPPSKLRMSSGTVTGGPRASFLLSLLDRDSFSSSLWHSTSLHALTSPHSGPSPGEHLNHQTKILTAGTALSSSRGGLKNYSHATFHDDDKMRQRSLDLSKEGKVQPWTWPKEGYFFSLPQPGHHSPRETFVRQWRIYNHNNPKSELALLLRHLYCW